MSHTQASLAPNGGPRPGSSQQPHLTVKKRRTNTSRACENCRRRRVKCDGVQPECGTCKVYKDECCWEAREDYRKPLSRQQVTALVTRVEDLEKLLREHGIDPAGAGKEESENRGLEDSVGAEDITWSQDHLVQAEHGEYQVHGPTSAFHHLGKYTHDHDRARDDPPAMSRNPSTGWLKHLPTDVPLARQQHDLAIDRFFTYYAPWGRRTHPILFMQDMHLALGDDPPEKTAHYSPLLHNAILAIGFGLSDDPRLRQLETRNIFARQAKGFLDYEGMNPNVATVQGLAHLASFHSLNAEHNLGWLYIGMASRCAYALGLNLDDKKVARGSGTLTRERNATFWAIFIQEALWAPYIGRPLGLPEFTTPIPTVDDSLDKLPWAVSSTSLTDSSAHLRGLPSMIGTTFLETTVKLMKIGERIMSTIYGIKSDMGTLVRNGVISEISLALRSWLEQLPPTLVLGGHSPKNGFPHILQLHLSWAWLVILLHRPFYRSLAGMPSKFTPPPSEPSSSVAWAVKHCDRAASQIVSLLQTWHRLHDLRLCPPTTVQCCFVAGTTHLLSLAGARSEARQVDALNRTRECIRLLALMAVSWPAARQSQHLLNSLLEEYWTSLGHPKPARLSNNVSPVEPKLQLAPPSGSRPPPASLPVEPMAFWLDSSSVGEQSMPLGAGHIWQQSLTPRVPCAAGADNSDTIPGVSLGQPDLSDFGPTLVADTTDPLDWDTSQAFDFSLPFSADTEALLDNLIQPHLDVGAPYRSDGSPWQWWNGT